MNLKLLVVIVILGINLSWAGEEGFRLIHIQDVVAQSKQASLFDANNKETRAKYGAIPGAKLLENYKYSAASTLPKDKNATLIFYCANEMCTASHKAAEIAVKAGYKNVEVLADGIQGWVKAGKPVEKVKL